MRRDFVAQYKQTILGPAWHLIQPLLTTITFTIIFGKIAQIPTDGVPPFLFYMAGTVLWSYFSGVLTGTSGTFVDGFGVQLLMYATPVIQVEHLSKHDRLGLIGGGTLREDLHRGWAKARGRPDPLLKIGQEDHGNREGGERWAPREVSFQVQEGEIHGIIGRHGAGKSTLLKILSRSTAPTTGQVKIRGRVGSLLEVGTGFHPELTGRENSYLNGAILGMKKAEIDRKRDEIIDFAEIEQFIDTPVKRYSSGMYVRQAFAVAEHLEPEI